MITIDFLRDMKRTMNAIVADAGGPLVPYPVPIYQDINALKDTEERTFPASRHRSARIRKKLIKRYGGEFWRAPAIFKTGRGFVCHPAVYGELVQRLSGDEARDRRGSERSSRVASDQPQKETQ